MPSATEASLIILLLTSLNSKYDLRLDTNPSVFRSPPDAAPAAAKRTTAIVLGGSNAGNLVAAFSTLGLHADSITSPGWTLSAAATSALLPQVTAACCALDRDVPAVLFMLDNSSYKCSDVDGDLSPIRRGNDNKFHVIGSLVVAPEASMAAVIVSLQKIIEACGARRILVLAPVPRYVSGPCCANTAHCTHLNEPEAGIRICCALHRLTVQLRVQLRDYPNCVVVSTSDILVGRSNSAPSDVLAASITNWGPVHGTPAAYAKLAKGVSELIGNMMPPKRPREETEASSAATAQRSRSLSFRECLRNAPPAGSPAMIQYPVAGRGRGRIGSSSSYY
jgi:hypothetical protein